VEHLMDALFDLSPQVRYVAIYSHGQLSLRQRTELSLASAPESDRYEELLVNPTILTLTRQRGEIDCGGLDYVVVRYGCGPLRQLLSVCSTHRRRPRVGSI
jgi:hypothetical protein